MNPCNPKTSGRVMSWAGLITLVQTGHKLSCPSKRQILPATDTQHRREKQIRDLIASTVLLEMEENKTAITNRPVAVKHKSGKCYSQKAEGTGQKNVYVAHG